MRRLPPERRSLPWAVWALHPDWLVLRPYERAALDEIAPGFDRRYRLVRVFSVDERSSRLQGLGLTMGNVDRAFMVYRRIGVRPL